MDLSSLIYIPKYFKARQPGQKFLAKNSNTLFVNSSLYLHCVSPYCENIFKIACLISEKKGK